MNIHVQLMSGARLATVAAEPGWTCRSLSIALQSYVQPNRLISHFVFNDRILDDSLPLRDLGVTDRSNVLAYMQHSDAVYCAGCDMWLNGPTQWEDHKRGKKHRKKRKRGA